MMMNNGGWILFDKPAGMSSARAVSIIKRKFDLKKVGHCGTLDPFATGLLILGFGQATKLMRFALGKDKEYLFTVNWDYSTDTLDNTGTRNSDFNKNKPTRDAVQNAIDLIGCGYIKQRPPIYSAISINGQRAYKMARDGVEVALEERLVKLDSLEILSHEDNLTSFRLKCGSGFYVRSLASDLGGILLCPAHVCGLRRVAIGDFSIANALKEEDLSIVSPKDINKFYNIYFLSIVSMIDDSIKLRVSEEVVRALRLGQAVEVTINGPAISEVVVVPEFGCDPVAVCKVSDSLLKPVRVFN